MNERGCKECLVIGDRGDLISVQNSRKGAREADCYES